MPGLPRLLVLILVAAAAWYLRRWLHQQWQNLPQRRPASPPPTSPAVAVEDLVRCGVCGAYVAAGAEGCRRRDCPRPR